MIDDVGGGSVQAMVEGYVNSVDWSPRMERWNGALEWSTGMEHWSVLLLLFLATN